MIVIIWAEFAVCFVSLLAASFYAWDEARIGAEFDVVQARTAKA